LSFINSYNKLPPLLENRWEKCLYLENRLPP
jgi:hypothetical protein